MPPLRSIGTGSEAELPEQPEYAGQYRLESVIGSGGMGVVHLATSASGLRLAVKVVHAGYAQDPEFRARFRQEVAAARRVSGAFTASVVDAATDAERPWMATLFIEGPTLAERVKRNGPMAPEELFRLGAGLAESLRDIHRVGVVHRDLKPSNVLLAADGPKVIDFGISRPTDSDLRTETGKLIGTPPFMAPEQFQRPREVGPAADVFAMGAVLVHAATGSGPFDSDSPYIVAYQVVHNEPDLAGVPDVLVPLITRCLAKDPADRPTPDELMAALRSAGYRTADDTEGFVAVEPPSPRADASPRRIPRRRAVLGVALALLLAGAAYGVHAMAAGDSPDRQLPTVQGEKKPVPRAWDISMRSGGENNTPACSYAGHALYCNAPGVKASRLSPVDGATVWSKKAAGSSRRAGQDRTPVLSGGLVQVVAPGGERLEALDPKSGAKRWSVGISQYPTVVHASRSVLLVAADGMVEALSNVTGETRWSERRGGLGTQWVASDGDGPALSVTPSADGSSSTVGAVDPDSGALLWEEVVDGMLSPVAASGGALFLLAYDTDSLTTAVVRLDTAPGAATRTARRVPLVTPLDQAQAAVHGDTVYVFGAGGSLLAVDTRRTGGARDAQRWRLETSVSRASQPVAARGRVYLAAADGRLLAVDAADGALLGQSKPRMDGGRQTFTPTLPAPVAVGDRIFATAPDGSVFALDARDPAGW